MNNLDAEQILSSMGAIWRQPLTPDQVVAWTTTLIDLTGAHVRTAIRALKETSDFMPSHAELIRAYAVAKRKADEAHQQEMLNQSGGTFCDCDHGWIEIDSAGHGTVKRCPKCNGPRQAEHKASCSCGLCRYGEVRWSEITMGRDGRGPKRERSLRLDADVPDAPNFYEPSEEF